MTGVLALARRLVKFLFVIVVPFRQFPAAPSARATERPGPPGSLGLRVWRRSWLFPSAERHDFGGLGCDNVASFVFGVSATANVAHFVLASISVQSIIFFVIGLVLALYSSAVRSLAAPALCI